MGTIDTGAPRPDYAGWDQEDGLAGATAEDIKAGRRTKAEQRAQSLEQILDAAEYLFSQNGLYGVTLRDVAERVGIHTTLLNYYFKDKVNLFEAVFARRAGVTAGRRMVALEQYERAAGDNPTVEGALHAFLDPRHRSSL